MDGDQRAELPAEGLAELGLGQMQMVGVREDRQPVGVVDHVLMEPARDLLRIAEFILHRAQDFRQQNVVLVRLHLPALQIQPAEQLLFLRREFDEAHSVAAVAGVVPLVGAQGVLHALCVQRDGARAERGLQLVHVLKRRIDRLR